MNPEDIADDATWDDIEAQFGYNFTDLIKEVPPDVQLEARNPKPPKKEALLKISKKEAKLKKKTSGDLFKFEKVISNVLPSTVEWTPIPPDKFETTLSDYTMNKGSERYAKLRWPANDPCVGRRSEMDHFLLHYPQASLPIMLKKTNEVLVSRKKKVLTEGEYFKWIGIWLAMCVVKLPARFMYWLTPAQCQHSIMTPMDFGNRYNMTEDRFNDILLHLKFADKPNRNDKGVDRWQELRPVVDAFNLQKNKVFSAGPELCGDESFSAYLGKNGAYADDGLPSVTKNPNKPKGVGLEINDTCCVQTGILTYCELAEGKEAMSTWKFTDRYPKHAAMNLRMTEFYHDAAQPVVFNADSKFSSLEASVALSDHGVKFRGMVKTCTKAYPKAAGNAHTFTERGETYALETTVNGVKHMAVMWGDRKRKVSPP